MRDRLFPLPRRSLPGLAAGALVAALCSSVPASAGDVQVVIDNFTFSPAELTVEPGTTVIWTNRDDIPHTVTANDKAFRSKPLDTGDRFGFTFTAPGAYGYFCSLHPHMTGRVVVRSP